MSDLLEECRALLSELEFKGGGWGTYCPQCGDGQPYHDDDCRLSALLRALTVEPEEMNAILRRVWTGRERRIGRRGDHQDRARGSMTTDSRRLSGNQIRAWRAVDRHFGVAK